MTVCPPTFSRVPDGDESTGQDCIDLAIHLGVGLDDWQQDVIRAMLRETVDADSSVRTWSASVGGLAVSRQSGKNQCLLAIELFALFELAEAILHTSHAVKTSSDAFRRLWSVIGAHDDLARRVRRHSQMIGAEYVELDSGARIAFTTRSASAGRGLSLDRLVVDEAEDLPAAEVAALAPTTFSRPKSQSLYFGTAPGPMHDSEAFETLRKSAHDGLNPRLCWFEWCADYSTDTNLDDQAMWLRVNPAVASGRVPLQAIMDDRAVLPVDAFRAERLSMWVPHGAESSLFSAESWDALADPHSVPESDIAIGVDVGLSRDAATVCVAGRRWDGRLHVEWYSTEDGVNWLPGWVASRLGPKVRAVVVDERGACAELPWKEVGVKPTLIDHRDVALAAGLFLDAVTEGNMAHRGQVELTKAVLGAKQRPIGQAFGWDRKGTGASVLIAASLAVLGVSMQRPVRPIPSGNRVTRPHTTRAKRI